MKKVPNKSKTIKTSKHSNRGVFYENYEHLTDYVKQLRDQNKKIVLTQGTFDFIHIGHFLYLERARAHGDVLIVGVDSDEKVKARKGPDRPIVSEAERVQMLTHVRHVDAVVVKPENAKKWELIKLIKPDVLIATQETYTPDQIIQLKDVCTEVIVLEPQATTSTTAKIRRLNIGLSHKMRDMVTEAVNDAFDKMAKNA